jgi:hypothetical protein
MFCPNCSQAFNAQFTKECPNCKYNFTGKNNPIKGNRDPRAVSEGKAILKAMDLPRVDAGVRQGLKLLFIAAGFFPVYLVLGSLYPANDGLVKGQRSADMFNWAGKAILVTLAVVGMLRIAYALIFDRRAAMRESGDV